MVYFNCRNRRFGHSLPPYERLFIGVAFSLGSFSLLWFSCLYYITE